MISDKTKPRRILTFFPEVIGTFKRLLDMPKKSRSKLIALVLVFVVPTVIVIPMLANRYSGIHTPESIYHREAFVLGVSIFIFGMLVRGLEDESFPILLTIAALWTTYIIVWLSLSPPF